MDARKNDVVLVNDGGGRVLGVVTDAPEDDTLIRVQPRDQSQAGFWCMTSQVERVWKK